jgi:hypothetical protein
MGRGQAIFMTRRKFADLTLRSRWALSEGPPGEPDPAGVWLREMQVGVVFMKNDEKT